MRASRSVRRWPRTFGTGACRPAPAARSRSACTGASSLSICAAVPWRSRSRSDRSCEGTVPDLPSLDSRSPEPAIGMQRMRQRTRTAVCRAVARRG